ncbi:hypothetical protein [Cellulomonas humilata]|uniref:Uncharacterized protein n=1 Tax=Cellulomonas humilata TaxID=144055 RepID=A0ABU0EEZ2_9CELL|nr:hypothetical protein [Cellulomonas humilata]MDQ0373850.1 hypothetical protein [Cellulomonas humilata]
MSDEPGAAGDDQERPAVSVSYRRRTTRRPDRLLDLDDDVAGSLLVDDLLADHVGSLDLEDLGLDVAITKGAVADLFTQRLEAVTRVFTTLDHLRQDLGNLLPVVPVVFPPQLTGRLVNPDGSPGAYVSVRALEPTWDTTDGLRQRLPWPNPEAGTDARGAFRLSLPPRPIPESGLTLLVTGSDRAVEVVLRRIDLVGGTGTLGVVPLDQHVSPLPRSVLSQLGDVLLPTDESDPVDHPEDFATPAHPISLGEGDCARSFRSGSGAIDRRSYRTLVRLVSPSLSAKRLATSVTVEKAGTFRMSTASPTLSGYADTAEIIDVLSTIGSWELVERVPVEAPIDVSKFLRLVKLNPRAVPKASTLGLGYTVSMKQLWIPTGMSLGDLVYSLPLAPGEQQLVAISEERETLSVREQEALTAEELQRYQDAADTSTSAVFSSAADEVARGGTEVSSTSRGFSAGGATAAAFQYIPFFTATAGIAGGYANSTTSGESTSWQRTSQDYVSSTAQELHSSLSRQAEVRKQASRTAMRLASASERRQIVTKVITNHNHNHALTMQYFQVLRHFGVTSTVEDVQLVCFVPLELVQFLPPLMPIALPSGTYPRNLLLYRYQELIRHHDVIAPRVARHPELRHGLRMLRIFAGDPTMTASGSSGAAQDILDVSVRGTFLPFEDVYVTAVSTTGSRIGPVRLSNASLPVAEGEETEAGLLQVLRDRRALSFETRTGSLTLPSSFPRDNLARFEFSRAFSTFSYHLTMPSTLELTELVEYLLNVTQMDVTLTPARLEAEVGGPLVEDPVVSIGGLDVIESYNGAGGSELMPPVLPISATRLSPVLAFADLLRIEALLQHVVENTVGYSKAVWQSLTPEERAIMLEPFTIGVPAGGLADPSDEVPLLSCVANEVLGYFGNSAVMPFFVPQPLAVELGFTSQDLQEALLTFHRQAYQPVQSSITLPARGVLGEAVLGSCSSSERIDLTRFWNWQDSPADTAPDLAAMATALGDTGNQLVGSTGATIPATTALPTTSLLTINGTAGAAAPVAAAPAAAQTSTTPAAAASSTPTDLTGATALSTTMAAQVTSTNASLTEAIKAATDLAGKALDKLPEAIAAKNGAEAESGTPPAETPPAETPPAETPPAETPPAETPA